MDNVVATRWFRHPWRRRLIAIVLLVLFGLLALFPRQYRVAMSLTPTDPSALGLSGALNQLGAYTNVFGSQAALEVSLKIARSLDTQRLVVRRLDLAKRLHLANALDATRWLQANVDVRTLRGGILQIEMKQGDAQLGLDILTAVSDATRERLAQISRNQTAYKRQILEQLVSSAGDRMDRAQAAFDAFRRSTGYSAPGPSIEAIGARVPVLEAQINGKEIELRSARAFATDENIQIRQILAEIAALRAQLSEVENLNTTEPTSINSVISQSVKAQKLERELALSVTLYNSYKGFLQGTPVENLTAGAQIRILEAPYIDTARQYRNVPSGLFILTLLVWLAAEFYLLRPPLGSIVYRERGR